MKRTLLLFFAFLLQAALLIAAPALAAGKRVALVIGNATYETVGTLANPITDAKAVSEAFTSAGFEDVRLVDDLSAEAMRRELMDFSVRAAEAEIAVVYYAGHGVEVADQNYLVPVDAKLIRSTDIEFEAIPLALRALCRFRCLQIAPRGAGRLPQQPFQAHWQKWHPRCNPWPCQYRTECGRSRGLRRQGRHHSPRMARPMPTAPYATALIKSLKEPGLEIRPAVRQGAG